MMNQETPNIPRSKIVIINPFKMLLEKQLLKKIGELFPKLKSRLEAPSREHIDKLREQHKELAEKDRRDKKKALNKLALNRK